MAPRRRAERCRGRILPAVLLGLLALAATGARSEAATVSAPLELRGRWLIGVGPFHRGGNFRLRTLDAQRCTLEIGLPPLALLPERQYLLRDGEALLTWTLPSGARPALAAESTWGRLLTALPPAAWPALLTGDGEALRDALTEAAAWREAGWTVCRGRLAGHPADLRLRGAGAWTLDWELPSGRLRGHWQAGVAGGPGWLRVRLPEGAWLRIRVRGAARAGLGPEDWLFLETGGNRGGQDAFQRDTPEASERRPCKCGIARRRTACSVTKT